MDNSLLEANNPMITAWHLTRQGKLSKDLSTPVMLSRETLGDTLGAGK